MVSCDWVAPHVQAYTASEFIRANGLRIGLEVIVNLVLPYLIYDFAEARMGQVHALLASSIPPIVWSVVEFARSRRIDAVSMLAIAGITLSLVAYVGSGSVQLLQMREKLVSVLIALVFLGSAAIGRPLIYESAKAALSRANNHTEVARFERLRNDTYFRNSMMIMTLVWGFGLLADSAVSLLLVFTLTVREYLVINPIIGYTVTGSLVIWNIWFVRRRRREGDKRRAAQASLDAEPVKELSSGMRRRRHHPSTGRMCVAVHNSRAQKVPDVPIYGCADSSFYHRHLSSLHPRR